MSGNEIPPPRPSIAVPVIFSILGIASIAGLIAMPWIVGASENGLASQWARFFGRFHPVVLHLPIGMLVLVILIEFGNLFRKEKVRSTSMPIFLTALSAAVAVAFGILLFRSKPGEYDETLIQSHLWWGTAFACLVFVCYIMKLWVNALSGRGNGFYFITLLGSSLVMAVASHDGGSLTHGKTFLLDEAPDEIRKIYNMLPVSQKLPLRESGDPNIKEQRTSTPSEQVVFTHLIQPIFDQKCVSCHGPEKQKGRFRMDTYEALIAGGKEGDGLKPGNAEDSNIIYRIHLPEDDEEHMPPEGKKQISLDELAILEWWINSGASPDMKLASADVPAEIKTAIASLVPTEDPAADDKPPGEAAGRDDQARQEIASRLEAVQKEFPSAINFESQDSSALAFNAMSLRKTFGDDQLKKLATVMPDLVSLDLSASTVTDQGIPLLANAARLKVLRLSETSITDASMEVLSALPELESLNLYGTKVTNAGALKLASLPKLKRLYLWQTQVDEAGVAELRGKLPDCEIVMGL